MREVKFFVPDLGKEEEEAVLAVMRSGWLTTGNVTLDFEKEFAAFLNRSAKEKVECLAVNSATSALLLSMDACGVSSGGAILTTPYTFVSTATSARHLGADVVFADTHKDDFNIDENEVERILTEDKEKKIKAVVPVHLGGNVCRMRRLAELCEKAGVSLIEDAAHAFPALTKDGYAGTLSDAGCFSFYVTKTMTTAEGGMIAVKDPKKAARMRTMRMHGMDRNSWDRYTSKNASYVYDVIEAGFKCNLPDILSAVGRVQLKKAESMLAARKKIVAMYNEAFKDSPFITLPPDGEGNSWHLYAIRLNLEKLKITRDEFAKKLQERGIGLSVHFIPLFHFTYYKNLYSAFDAAHFPNAEANFLRVISLPLWTKMREEDVEAVVSAVKTVAEENCA